MKLLLDSNIVIDYLTCREPFYKHARLLMMLGLVHEHDLFISPAQANDIIYVLTHGENKLSQDEAADQIKKLREFVGVCTIGAGEFDEALVSGWSDIEDAFVYQAARSIRADAIITRNQKGFEKSSIKVFDCDEFFAWVKKEYNVSYEEIDF